MKKHENDKLTDILMGEAVLALLQKGKHISARSLLSELHIMLNEESTVSRQLACLNAIAEVESAVATALPRTTVTVRDGEDVGHLFTNDGPADNARKH